MAFKLIILSALLAFAQAGLIGAPVAQIAAPIAYSPAAEVSHISYSSPIVSYGTPLAAQPAIVGQSQNILRSFGNLGQVSTYSKTIDTPFSSVSKSDVRVSNPGIRYASAPVFQAPGLHLAGPAIAAPVSYSAAPAVSHVSYQGLAGGYVF